MVAGVERDPIQFREPILEQKDVKAVISFVESTQWKPKEAVHALTTSAENAVKDSYKAIKMTVRITDDSVRTEHEDASPKLVVEDQFNQERYPYVDKKKGAIGWMNRGKLFNLEDALGFDPCYVDGDGKEVEPFVTRTGSKTAPKVPGVARVLNPAFVGAYFNEDGTVNPTNWIDKPILVDIGVEKSEQFGNKNTITRYKKVGSL